MTPPKLRKSERSLRSLRGFEVLIETTDDKAFEDQLAEACSKYECEFFVHTKKSQLKDIDHVYNVKKSDQIKRDALVTFAKGAKESDKEVGMQTTEAPDTEFVDEDYDSTTIHITSIYSNTNKLIEVHFFNIRKIPRKLMQVVGLTLPKFKTLSKMVVRRSGVDHLVMYELAKALPLSHLTDICLDDTWIPEANYYLLLDNPTKLQNLSLARCKLNDKFCQELGSRIVYNAPATDKLLLLNLSSNFITDEGAKHIGQALRSNRSLRYLNLSDNRISDEGAINILGALTSFPLTYDEIIQFRKRFLNYLRKKQALFQIHFMEAFKNVKINQQNTKNRLGSQIKVTSKKKQEYNEAEIREGAYAMAAEDIGNFDDPFCVIDTEMINEWRHCRGNMVLSYLNLAFNNISYITVKKLSVVLKDQQRNQNPALRHTGLIKVVIEGNNLPDCNELGHLNDMLAMNIAAFGTKVERRKSRRMSQIDPKMLSSVGR